MGDHFDIIGVFETTEFEIAKSACISNIQALCHAVAEKIFSFISIISLW